MKTADRYGDDIVQHYFVDLQINNIKKRLIIIAAAVAAVEGAAALLAIVSQGDPIFEANSEKCSIVDNVTDILYMEGNRYSE